MQRQQQQQQQQDAVGRDPRWPRPQAAATPRPPQAATPRPPLPAMPRPTPPAPPAAQVPAARIDVIPIVDLTESDEETECRLDVGPGTAEQGIPGTGAENLAPVSSSTTVSVGVVDANPEGNPQSQAVRRRHVADQDNDTIKRIKVKDQQKQTTQGQDLNSVPPVEGSAAAGNSNLGHKDVTDLLVKIHSQKAFDASKATQDSPNCQSDDTVDMANLKKGSRIYIDPNGNLYSLLENITVIGVQTEDRKIYYLTNNRGINDTGLNTGLLWQPVERFTITRGQDLHMQGTVADRNCSATPCNRPTVSNHPSQGGAPQCAASLPKGTEQQIPCGKLDTTTQQSVHTEAKMRNKGSFTTTSTPGQQRADSTPVELTTRPRGFDISLTMTPSFEVRIFNGRDASGNESRATQAIIPLPEEGDRQLPGHLPQQHMQPSNVPTTAAPFGQGASSQPGGGTTSSPQVQPYVPPKFSFSCPIYIPQPPSGSTQGVGSRLAGNLSGGTRAGAVSSWAPGNSTHQEGAAAGTNRGSILSHNNRPCEAPNTQRGAQEDQQTGRAPDASSQSALPDKCKTM